MVINRRTLLPVVLWAQRKDTLLVKIDLPDVQNANISLTEQKIHFAGESQGKKYAVDVEVYKDIEPKVCCSSFHHSLLLPLLPRPCFSTRNPFYVMLPSLLTA
jgi:hypothetical protein